MKAKTLNKRKNKGVSTVIGSILFMLVVVTIASTLFIALYTYHQKTQEAIVIEQERAQERIVLKALSTNTSNGVEYVKTVSLTNNGSITSWIRAIYIDNKFLCDPSILSTNPTTCVNVKGSLQLNFPNGVPYNETAKLTIATERGIRATEIEGSLKNNTQSQPPAPKWGFGPLMLNFTEFYYMNYSDWRPDGNFSSSKWAWGWHVTSAGQAIVWNITVTNIDTQDITLSQFSCLTLIPNDQQSNTRCPWYIQPTTGNIQIIPSKATTNIIYVWKTSDLSNTPQNAYNQGTNRIFLTFFGNFTANGKKVASYGQTIPFEAVIVI
jgi:hypothetical protein